MTKCPICKENEAFDGWVRCRWEDRSYNEYFHGVVCDRCWDRIIIPLVNGRVKKSAVKMISDFIISLPEDRKKLEEND